jgi:hypothetical protein
MSKSIFADFSSGSPEAEIHAIIDCAEQLFIYFFIRAIPRQIQRVNMEQWHRASPLGSIHDQVAVGPLDALMKQRDECDQQTYPETIACSFLGSQVGFRKGGFICIRCQPISS